MKHWGEHLFIRRPVPKSPDWKKIMEKARHIKKAKDPRASRPVIVVLK